MHCTVCIAPLLCMQIILVCRLLSRISMHYLILSMQCTSATGITWSTVLYLADSVYVFLCPLPCTCSQIAHAQCALQASTTAQIGGTYRPDPFGMEVPSTVSCWFHLVKAKALDPRTSTTYQVCSIASGLLCSYVQRKLTGNCAHVTVPCGSQVALSVFSLVACLHDCVGQLHIRRQVCQMDIVLTCSSSQVEAWTTLTSKAEMRVKLMAVIGIPTTVMMRQAGEL